MPDSNAAQTLEPAMNTEANEMAEQAMHLEAKGLQDSTMQTSNTVAKP